MSTPVILELALNGATPRSRNRHVPRTPAQIAEVALEGIALGASIVHNHNDEPMFTADGVHAVEPYLQAWRPVLDRYPDVLLYPTMAAGARGISVPTSTASSRSSTPGRRPASRVGPSRSTRASAPPASRAPAHARSCTTLDGQVACGSMTA